MKYVKGATLDKSTMAESRKQKFAHVYENGRDFSESLKRQGTSLKKVDSLDTCTRTELFPSREHGGTALTENVNILFRET